MSLAPGVSLLPGARSPTFTTNLVRRSRHSPRLLPSGLTTRTVEPPRTQWVRRYSDSAVLLTLGARQHAHHAKGAKVAKRTRKYQSPERVVPVAVLCALCDLGVRLGVHHAKDAKIAKKGRQRPEFRTRCSSRCSPLRPLRSWRETARITQSAPRTPRWEHRI